MSEELHKIELEFINSISTTEMYKLTESRENPIQLLSKFKTYLIEQGEHATKHSTFECALCERKKSVFNRTEGRPNVCEKCNREELHLIRRIHELEKEVQ